MKTIHMIGQAHLDPVWVWPWQDGMDEALATYRTACDLLDEYPEFVFSHGEAWTYKQVEAFDPALFGRICGHVESGRWEIVGGWWIQPDCNAPSGFGLERQIALGKEFFLDRFGFFPETAFNVDSFGHAASLPGYMRAAGQNSYIMMRPQEHEMELPARLFRWRGFEDGPEVVTFRIAYAYTWGDSIDPSQIEGSLSGLPDGIEHTMYFYGVGDHGGGPTARMIRWIIENENSIDGCRLVFSSPRRFFDAIHDRIESLPVVTGELQHHAIGCYSVERGIKTRVRRAEHALRQAELVTKSELRDDWQRVCFNHFHDILGGTSIPSAYSQCYAQVDSAICHADETLHGELRKRLAELPDDANQRIVMLNASDAPFAGYTEHEIWTQWQDWQPTWRVLDANDRPIPFQVLPPESYVGPVPRLLFKTQLDPGELSVVKIDRSNAPTEALPEAPATNDAVSFKDGSGVSLADGTLTFPGGVSIGTPRVDLIEDKTDNWSHGIDRYSSDSVDSAHWDPPALLHRGALMSSLLQFGVVGQSRLQAEWRVYEGEPLVDLRLRVHWTERWKILKLSLSLPRPVPHRLDGIPGASLRRANDGKERPLMDWTLVDLGESRLGVICPQVFALDSEPERLRFTLLRSAVMTHHDPRPADMPAPVFSDQGVHDFRFDFCHGKHVNAEFLDKRSLMLQRPLVTASLTRGMPR